MPRDPRDVIGFINTPKGWSERAVALADPHLAVGWSPEGQRERFRAVLDALEPAAGESLLDFGCGLGALADWLPPDVKYVGYDWAPAMISRAQIEHPDRTFRNQLPRRPFDLIACVGTFNVPGSKEETWQTLRELWEDTGRALAVSLYAGDDPLCLKFTTAEAVAFADPRARRFEVTPHRQNDILLVLRR